MSIALLTPKSEEKSDIIGAVASGLCAIHCLATPILFVAQSCSASACCSSSPAWWSSIDYIFIGITLIAVFFSARNTSKRWVFYGLWATWFALSFLVINEKFAFLPIHEAWKYGAAAMMISLHLYNLKYCRCQSTTCCSATHTSPTV